MKAKHFIVILLSILFIQSCQRSSKLVDTVLFNGHIYTMNDSMPVAEVIIIDKGKIIDIGSKTLLNQYHGKTTTDLNGQWVYPGFIDAHCHFLGYANNQLQCNLIGSPSWEAVIDSLKQFEKTLDKNEPLIGRGWDQNDWESKAFPDNQLLNQLFPNRAVVLKRIDGHAVICNQAALSAANIVNNTKITGGEIICKQNTMTGVLVDNAVNLVDQYFTYHHDLKLLNAIRAAEQLCFSKGLTSLADAGLPLKECLYLDSLGQANQRRIFLYMMLNPEQAAVEFAKSKGHYENQLSQIASFKLYADGALGSRGAKLKADYCDRAHHNGYWVSSKEMLQDFCKDIYENTNYQINTHCIGDSANRLLLDIYGQQLKGKNDRRWRIEHAQLVDPTDRALFKQYSIIPSVQPTHATSDAPWVSTRICDNRMASAYAYQSLLKQNDYLALGTDFPVEYIDPFFTIYSAVFRLSAQRAQDKAFLADEALSMDQTLKGMTIWAAKACRLEQRKGSLSKGKDADLVVIDRDFYHLPNPKALLSSKVIATYALGQKVY